jgi:hypothetical protein
VVFASCADALLSSGRLLDDWKIRPALIPDIWLRFRPLREPDKNRGF